LIAENEKVVNWEVSNACAIVSIIVLQNFMPKHNFNVMDVV